MNLALRSFLSIFALLCGALPARAIEGPPVERGTAITDPAALRELDRGRFGLSGMLMPTRWAAFRLNNAALFASPMMAGVRKALDEEFESYIEKHKATLPNDTIGFGAPFDFQLFDHALLYARNTRFVLAGIVNRMDRAYVSPDSCGEIRLIYRLTRTGPDRAAAVASRRLPMTLNLVLKAKGARDNTGIDCASIASRWLAAGELQLTGAELAAKLTAKDGPLDLVRPENIARIETNLQIAHAPKSAVRDFRTDYLFKVFDYNARARVFEEAPLENQIDRERLLSDPGLAADFKAWLLDPVNFGELDRGTVLIPERFLAKSAIAPTPVGFVASDLQPAFGLVANDHASSASVFSSEDVVAALKEATARGITLQNIRSAAGFERRLNDITCAGCHQTRGIGGFHFPGVDWMTAKPSNSVTVPASPHFFGDQVRRRDILAAFRDGRQPDFSRGFSSRPQVRGSTELAGTEYQDGWGAHCYQQHANSADDDPSFRAWTCAAGLACQAMSPATQMGMCFIKSR